MSNRSGLPCPYVDCGSSDAFSWHSDGYGKCFSCDSAYPKKNMGEVFDWVEETYPLDGQVSVGSYDDGFSKDVVETTAAAEDMRYRPWRGISKETMEFFGVLSDDRRQGYPYPNGKTKYRVFPKDFSQNKGFKPDCLFGANLFPTGYSRYVVVTEGELDAMSAWQMLKKTSGGNYKYAVVSLPSANPPSTFWENVKPYLESFERVILSGDSDKVGREVAEKLFDMIPERVFVMDHGKYKDANEFLQDGAEKQYKDAWWGARRYTPAGFTSSVEDWVKAVTEDNPYTYVETHIPDLNEGMRGWLKGGSTILKAPPGAGKSTMVRSVIHDLLENKEQRVAFLMMEEVDGLTARAMATYKLGVNVNTEEDQRRNGVTDEELIAAIREIAADERFVSFTVDPLDPIESCLKQVKYASAVYGCDYVFIDHLQKLAYMAGTESATEKLTSLIVNLNELCVRRGIGVIAISHMNEDGKTKYAKSIEEEAYVILKLLRDKQAEGPERNEVQILVEKNRPFAYTGPAGCLVYDHETTMVKPKTYLGD